MTMKVWVLMTTILLMQVEGRRSMKAKSDEIDNQFDFAHIRVVGVCSCPSPGKRKPQIHDRSAQTQKLGGVIFQSVFQVNSIGVLRTASKGAVCFHLEQNCFCTRSGFRCSYHVALPCRQGFKAGGTHEQLQLHSNAKTIQSGVLSDNLCGEQPT